MSHSSRLALIRLNADIDERVRSIRASCPDWPCARGCDTCCWRLATVPLLTRAEWVLLRQGIESLTDTLKQEVSAGIAALADSTERPIRCPLLDPQAGACRVYPFRPVACRSYGFYVQRGQGLYCKEIECRVAAGDWADAIWGNQDAVERRLDDLGERRELPEWLCIDLDDSAGGADRS